jgi:hypothetical protein
MSTDPVVQNTVVCSHLCQKALRHFLLQVMDIVLLDRRGCDLHDTETNSLHCQVVLKQAPTRSAKAVRSTLSSASMQSPGLRTRLDGTFSEEEGTSPRPLSGRLVRHRDICPSFVPQQSSACLNSCLNCMTHGQRKNGLCFLTAHVGLLGCSAVNLPLT